MGTSSMTEGRQEKPAERPESSLQGWQSPDNQWLTLEQVAELTGLADRTIRHNCKHGKYQTKLVNANGGEQYRILASSLPEAAYQKWCQEQLARIGYQTASRMPALRPENQADMWSTDKQRLTADARKGVAALVERTMAMTGLTQQAAIASILEQAAKGQLDTHTMKLLSCARDPRGKAGLQVDGYLLPSARSLLRMLSQAKQVLTGDNSTLIPKVPQPSRQIPAWAKAFLAAYQVPAKPSVAAAYEVFKQEWLSQHPLGTLPSVHQVRRFLDKLGKVDKETGRKLPRELKAMKAFVRRDTSNLLPTDVYSIDGHTFDAEVEHPFHGRPFRPEITTVIDVATRMVVGISAGLKEGWMSVLSALRHGVTVHGIPAVVYVDNGSGYQNAMMKNEITGFMGRLGITVTHSIAYNSQARGVIERVQKTLWVDGLAKRMPTYMGADMDREARQVVHKITRQEVKKRGEAMTKLLPSWNQFWEMALEEVDGYNRRPHRSLPKVRDAQTGKSRNMTPLEAWQRAQADGFEAVTVGKDEATLLFMPEEIRVTMRGELSLFSNRYFAPELEPYTGERVRVAFDPYDAKRVIVKTMEGRVICAALFEANKRDYFPTSFVEQAARKRAQSRADRLQNQLEEVQAELTAGRALGFMPGETLPMDIPATGRVIDMLEVVNEEPEAPALQAAEVPTLLPGRKTCLPTDVLIDNDHDQYVFLIQHAREWTEHDAAWLMEYVAGDGYEDLAERYAFFGQGWNQELEHTALAVLKQQRKTG